MIRHKEFLKSVFVHSISTFGGPQAHLGIMINTFVEKRKDITLTELMDVYSFCQIMPGATSTQTLTLIGYKRGGISLAVITLLIWMLPATVLMSSASFFVGSKFIQVNNSHFSFIQPMALGFLLYAAIKALFNLKDLLSKFIMVFSSVIIFIFFKSPWIFPIVFILSISISIVFNKSINTKLPFVIHKIRWSILILFSIIFIFSGLLSESARINNWKERTPFNLFENMYRFGSIVFGGVNVLIPVMYEQYVVRPTTKKVSTQNQQAIRIESKDFLTGAGLVRAIPGPAFSISSYVGGLAMRNQGIFLQVLGCLIAAFAIFLPSFFLVLFFYPIWENLHRFTILHNVIFGINAAVVGIMIASILYLTRDTAKPLISLPFSSILLFLFVMISTFILLYFTRIPAPLIALFCLILGYFF